MKLGQDFDILDIVTPVDLGAAASTGNRVHMSNYGTITFACSLNNGTAAQAPTFTLQEHNAASAGTSQNLVVIDTYYQKEAATINGDEAWVEVTQTVAATVTDADWDDANQVLCAFSVEATDLSDGFEWLSVNVDDPGTAHVGAVWAVAGDLKFQMKPSKLAQPNA